MIHSDYLTCALWSSNDNSNDQGGNPLDSCKFDVDQKTLAFLDAKASEFYDKNTADCSRWDELGYFWEHDLWLTQNGHGTGFWDRKVTSEEDKAIRDRLSDAARNFGELSLYVGDDQLIHCDQEV